MIEYGLSAINVEHEHATVTVYPDHANKNQFWYLPQTVSLKLDSKGKPTFTFVEYIKEAKAQVSGGGFLNFAVDLRLSSEHHDAAVSEIAAKFGRDRGKVVLTAVPYDSGEVDVVYFQDSKSAEVWKAKSPSLFGNNDAIFGLSLSETQTALLNSSYTNGGKPVGVAYYLNFTAMRPAINVSIKANFNSLQERVEQGLNIVAPIPFPDPSQYVKATLGDIVENLEKDGKLEIKIEDMANSAETKAAKEWAKNYVIEKILDTFFEIEIPAEQGKSEGASMGELALKALYMGKAAFQPPLVELKYVKVTKTEDKKFEFNYSESTPIKLTHAPQGFFESDKLLKGEDKSKFFQSVDISNSFFSKLSLQLNAPAKDAFEQYDLSQVQARFKYDNAQKDERFAISEAGTQKMLSWQKKDGNGVYQQQVELVYKGSPEWEERTGWSTPNKFVTAWQNSEDWEPGLEPSQINVKSLQLAVAVDEIDWEQVASVRVKLEHARSGTKKELFFNKSKAGAQKWNLRTYDQDAAYTYSVDYVLKSGGQKTVAQPQATTLTTLYVPMPEIENVMRLRTDADMMKEYRISTASVFLKYPGSTPAIKTKDFDFDNGETQPKRWAWSPSSYDANAPQPYEWRIEFVGDDDDYYYPGPNENSWETSSRRNQRLRKALESVRSDD
ncbi:MAG: hypothetical protein AAF490_20885 [Chloroflexota bacterium]